MTFTLFLNLYGVVAAILFIANYLIVISSNVTFESIGEYLMVLLSCLMHAIVDSVPLTTVAFILLACINNVFHIW